MDEYRVRAGIFGSLILIVLTILGMRLAWLQLLARDLYANEATNNAIREVFVRPARGAVYDRNGLLMVDNAASYALSLTPRYFPHAPGTRHVDSTRVTLLAGLLGVPDSTVFARLAVATERNPDAPTVAFTDLDLGTIGRVLAEQFRFRTDGHEGVSVDEKQMRRYLTDARATHAIGYVREIGKTELGRRYDDGYRRGDLIGVTGVERNYEMYLRGKLGLDYVVRNARGLPVDTLAERSQTAISGYDLVLTLDSRLQAFAESLFVGKRGGAVALDPQTGEILSMISMPDYDLTTFSRPVSQDMWRYLNESKTKPMFNRATQSMQPPGSTWKPFMALMALQEGSLKVGEHIYCGGGHPLGGGRFFRCMHRDGSIEVVQAIEHSCNTFFFELMYRTDVNTYQRYAHMFGFGERALTDVGEQTPGLIPDSAYFNRNYGVDKWGPGFTINLGIGQGNMGATPFELARYVGIVGAAGRKPAPHLIRELRHPETGETIRPTIPAPETLPIKDEYFQLVRDGMRGVMERGTGRSLQIPNILSGGKTGTAQAPGVARRDNSVFIMFAPFDNPKIAIAVQVENAGFGATAAGPIASLMAEYYLTGTISPERKALVARAVAAQSQALPGDDIAPPRRAGTREEGRSTLNDDGPDAQGRIRPTPPPSTTLRTNAPGAAAVPARPTTR